ncbi:MAG: GDP-L-fucose synthase family protein [Lysobacterales bacterium]
MQLTGARIFVAGHQGMVGRALCRELAHLQPEAILLTAQRSELDLTDRSAVSAFLSSQAIDQVIIAAARVGGIVANNTLPAQFISDNLAIALNLIDGAWQAGIEHLLFLGSSCIYPREAEQPIAESQLLTGPLEPTNEPYAIAKIAGIKLCESYNRQYGTDYRSVMPTNLYGPFDRFDLTHGHVIPALIRRIHEASEAATSPVKVWGSGKARREFLHVDDLAKACCRVIQASPESIAKLTSPQCSHINVGTGSDISIFELAHKIAAVVGYSGELEFDHNQPEGTPLKRLDNTLIHQLGWQADTTLDIGLAQTYRWYQQHGPNR